MNVTLLRLTRGVLPVVLALAVTAVVALPRAGASEQAPVDLGTADFFAVLGGQTVTNTGPSVINGDLGVSPGTAVPGFPPGIVNGTLHAADAVASQAQSDLTIAYNDAAGRASDLNLTGQDLGGLTSTAGVSTFDTSAQLTGTHTIDAQNNPDAVFIFQVGSTLTTATNSSVSLINGAQACRVFWQIGSSATLGTNTTFVGNVLALTSITAVTDTTVDGRLLARNGAVTLDTNVITTAECAEAPSTTTTTTLGGGDGPTTTLGGGPTTTLGGGGGPTTTLGGEDLTTGDTARAQVSVPTTTTTTTAPGGGSTVTTTVAASSTSTGLGEGGSSRGSPVTSDRTSDPTSNRLAQTGGRMPLVGVALGLLFLVSGALTLQRVRSDSQ